MKDNKIVRKKEKEGKEGRFTPLDCFQSRFLMSYESGDHD